MSDKTILMPHIGGDGAHFIISLISKYISNTNNQIVDDSVYTLENNYLGVWSPYWIPQSYDSSTCDLIVQNIDDGKDWNAGLELVLPDFDPGKWSFQQMHTTMLTLCDHMYGNKKYQDLRAITIYTDDIETQLYIFNLDIVKNKMYDQTKDFMDREIIVRANVIRGHVADTLVDCGENRVLYINYNDLILKQDIQEFIKIADWLGEKLTAKHNVILQEIAEYHARNLEVVDQYRFNKTKMLGIAKYIYEDI